MGKQSVHLWYLPSMCTFFFITQMRIVCNGSYANVKKFQTPKFWGPKGCTDFSQGFLDKLWSLGLYIYPASEISVADFPSFTLHLLSAKSPSSHLFLLLTHW